MDVDFIGCVARDGLTYEIVRKGKNRDLKLLHSVITYLSRFLYERPRIVHDLMFWDLITFSLLVSGINGRSKRRSILYTN